MSTNKETRVGSQSGRQPKPPKPMYGSIAEHARASKPGLPYTGAPGHSGMKKP